jgi:hypothetical protein
VSALCQIPHTSRFFWISLLARPALAHFSLATHIFQWLKDEAGKIQYDSARRQKSRVLERQNKNWERLRKLWKISHA